MAYEHQRIAIELSDEEMRTCREMGVARQGYAEKRGFKPYGAGSAETHARGYMGELAMSKYLGIPMPEDWTWEADQRRGHDVGGYQCRTWARDDGSLLIRPTDKPGTYALLLTYERPVIYLVGWCTLEWANQVGVDGKTPGTNPRPCKYVAQRQLIPFPNISGSICIRGNYAPVA